MKIKNILFSALLAALFFLPGSLYGREFLNAFMHINLGISYGFTQGELPNHEFDSFSVSNYRPTHYSVNYNLGVDFMPIPPLILGRESNAIKIGIRGQFRYHYMYQKISFETDNEYVWTGNLLRYKSWMVGPVIYWSPVISTADLSGNYRSGGGFTLFALYGQSINGELTAYPIRTTFGDYTGINGTGKNAIGFSSYKLEFGFGGAIAFCSINFGFNVSYSIMFIKTDYPIYTSLGSNTSLSEITFEIYVGIPIEWSRIPLLY